MTTRSGFRGGNRRVDELGFSIIESIVAVTLLAIAIVLTIPPIMNTMLSNQRSKELTTSENLAQARIEEIRALDYDDVGNPGFAPDGVVDFERFETIEGIEYKITTKVTYEGSLTGLDVVDQGTGGPGGDGIPGTWDPGVDYKYVVVTVESPGREHDPIQMESIVSPASIGAHEDIANARVSIFRMEPYGPYPDLDPELRVQPTIGPTQRSGVQTPVQIFPGLDPDTYTIELETAAGWLIHPDDVAGGATSIDVIEGALTDGVIRVYRPVELTVSAFDVDTSASVSPFQVTLIDLGSGTPYPFPMGDTSFPDLVPGLYDVVVAAPGYFTETLSAVDITGSVSIDTLHLDVPLTFDPTPTVTVAFWANTWIGSGSYTAIRGADVRVVHSGLGIDITQQTDADGYVYLDLPPSTTGFSATGTSPFGHSPDTDAFSTGTGPMTVDLNLGRPNNRRRFVMTNGDDVDHFRYMKINGPPDPTWRTPHPLPNSDGIATVVVQPGQYRLRAYCSGGGYKASIDIWTSGSQTTKTWNAPGSCP